MIWHYKQAWLTTCISDENTHVLQWVYITHGGFWFPFAHFATSEAQAPEFVVILWDIVDNLRLWGFQVKAVLSNLVTAKIKQA